MIISTGQQFRLQKLKDIPENIHIYKSVPQIEVLKQADVFVTHGGMNSVSEALVHGVPMVVIPFISDQPANAKRIEQLGLGKKLEYRQVNRDALKNIVLSVLSDKNVMDNISNMQRLVNQAPGNRGGASMIVDYYNNNI